MAQKSRVSFTGVSPLFPCAPSGQRINSDLYSSQILVVIRLTTWDTVPIISRFDSEKYYKDPNKNNATYPFPIMEEEGSIDLSVIVPSYNEEERCKFIIKLFVCLAAQLNDATFKRLLSFICRKKKQGNEIKIRFGSI